MYVFPAELSLYWPFVLLGVIFAIQGTRVLRRIQRSGVTNDTLFALVLNFIVAMASTAFIIYQAIMIDLGSPVHGRVDNIVYGAILVMITQVEALSLPLKREK